MRECAVGCQRHAGHFRLFAARQRVFVQHPQLLQPHRHSRFQLMSPPVRLSRVSDMCLECWDVTSTGKATRPGAELFCHLHLYYVSLPKHCRTHPCLSACKQEGLGRAYLRTSGVDLPAEGVDAATGVGSKQAAVGAHQGLQAGAVQATTWLHRDALQTYACAALQDSVLLKSLPFRYCEVIPQVDYLWESVCFFFGFC